MFIEDLLAEDDWDGFVQAHQKLKGVKLIGDDFIVTNRRRLQKAYECHALDGFILKPNQVGTITEALDTHAYAQSSGLLTIPSGRSGGAVGDIVADLALALEAPISKKRGTQVRRAAGQNQLPAPRQQRQPRQPSVESDGDIPSALPPTRLKTHRTVKKFAATSDSLVKNDKIRYN